MEILIIKIKINYKVTSEFDWIISMTFFPGMLNDSLREKGTNLLRAEIIKTRSNKSKWTPMSEYLLVVRVSGHTW